MFHRDASPHQAGGERVPELMGVDVVNANLLSRGYQGFLKIDLAQH